MNTKSDVCTCEKYEDAQREIAYLQRQYAILAEQYREAMDLLKGKAEQ